MSAATTAGQFSGILALCLGLQAVAATPADPLFDTDDALEITIEAPFLRIMEERPDDEYVPARLRVAGNGEEFDIGIRTRGQFRRQVHICPFAPLRLNFTRLDTPETIFANQDKLKLVTHCRDSSVHYEQTVLTEYLAYRILNELSDYSYRVRLLRVTYVYTDADRQITKPAFAIEADDRLAARLGRPIALVDEIDVEQLDPGYTNLSSVFQYLIGNTDFSPISSREDEECCHNHTPLGTPGGPYLSIPYDFDMTGIVNAKHAVTNPRFRLRSVRQRLYRGRCEHNDLLEETLQHFRDRRAALEGLIDEVPELSERARRDTRRYLSGFYSVINSESRSRRLLYDRCI